MNTSTLIILGHIAILATSIIVLLASFVTGNNVIGMTILLGTTSITLLNLVYLLIAKPSEDLTINLKRLAIKTLVVGVIAIIGTKIFELPAIGFASVFAVSAFFLHAMEGFYIFDQMKESNKGEA